MIKYNVNDYVGKRFGHLVLISNVPYKNKHNATVYECRCDCGNTCYKRMTVLVTGHDKTCGKCKLAFVDRKKTGNYTKDISGQKYGKLTAIKIVGEDKYGRKKWLFECECGRNIIASENNVTQGTTKSCGCLKHEPSKRRLDLVGQRFGRLVVQRFAGKANDGGVLWECLCDCGNTTITRTSSLRAGVVNSCGCLRDEIQTKDSQSNSLAMLNKRIFEQECAACCSNEHLHSHHILPRNKFPQYAKNPHNGIVLCSRCHTEFHKRYGYNCDSYDLVEFLGLPRICGDIINNLITFRDNKGKEDLEKAKHCIDMLIELEYGIEEK